MFTSHFFRGPGRSVRQWQQWLLPPASSSFSALPSSPDPLRPTPHRRRVPMVAKRKPRRFSSMALFREYDINTHAVTARTKFQTLKLQKNIWPLHIEEEQISPTLMADAALKEAVDWLFVQGSIVSRFDVIRQMRLILVTFHTKVALMSLLVVWRRLCALIL